MDMSEPSCETGDVALDIDAIAIPPQQRVHRESMTHVMQARADSVRL